MKERYRLEYCDNCKKYMHTALCNGASSSGYLVNYAHNGAQNGKAEVYIGSCYECKNPYSAMYSVHMDSMPTVTHTVDSNYPTNFTATAKSKMTVFGPNHESVGNHYVDLYEGSSEEGTNLQMWTQHGEAPQKF